ncbi:MAG TPA: hypothetical protein DEP66_01540 [Acidimicrobiaceae bacterium]|nr:hypothetical protein [Acidimicrobiaceae bacterium]
MFSPGDVGRFDGDAQLTKRRREAAEFAEATGLPSFTEEVWRYSPIDDLDLDRYTLAVPGETPTAGKGSSGTAGYDTVELSASLEAGAAAVVSVVNGRFESAEVRSAGLTVRTLDCDYDVDGVAPAGTPAGDLLGSVMTEPVDVFAAANLAYTGSPIVVEVAPGAVVDGPVLVRSRTDADAVAWFPRLVVVAGRDSEAVVVEQHTGADVEALVCPVTELRVGDAARLSHVTVQQLGPRMWQIAAQVAETGRDSSLGSHHIALGGGYARARIDSRLAGTGGSAEVNAAYFGRGTTSLDFRTHQVHAGAHTTSNLLFKGALDDSSRAVYTGLIRIEPDAAGVSALQTNRNLKLSPQAWSESVPNLEIENNDVMCSHASATGPVDAEQTFYLERLGVPPDTAEALVVRGFFDDVLATLPVPEIGTAAGDRIAALLADRAGAAGDPTARAAP